MELKTLKYQINTQENKMITIDLKEEFCNSLMETPKYAHLGDSGVDLQANLEAETVIKPGCRKLIPTGIFVGLPSTQDEDFNWEIQLRPRSGLAHKKGITVLNSPGTIDSTYRGQIYANLHNTDDFNFVISPGDKIAQAVLTQAFKMKFNIVTDLNKTVRGEDGHGSTGVKA